MPMTKEIHCLKCPATGVKTLNMIGGEVTEGWMAFVGASPRALNREVYLCPECGKSVPEQRPLG